MHTTADIHTGPLEVRQAQTQPLIDNPVGLIVTGCEPGATVEMTALVDVAGAIYDARATFIADDSGRVDTAVHPSQGGTYSGVDPFGLWWSGQPLRQSTTPPLTLATCRLRVEAGGKATESVLERRWLGVGGSRSADSAREPAWSSSSLRRRRATVHVPRCNCLHGLEWWHRRRRNRRAAILARVRDAWPLRIRRPVGLPRALIDIEVEVVERALGWLRRQPDIAWR